MTKMSQYCNSNHGDSDGKVSSEPKTNWHIWMYDGLLQPVNDKMSDVLNKHPRLNSVIHDVLNIGQGNYSLNYQKFRKVELKNLMTSVYVFILK